MQNLPPEEYKECLGLLGAWFDYQDLHAGQGSFARARWAVKKLAKYLDLETISVQYNEKQERISVEEQIKELVHIIEIAEKLDGEEEISEPQPHHRLWSIIAGNRATIKRLAEDNKRLREQLEKNTEEHACKCSCDS